MVLYVTVLAQIIQYNKKILDRDWKQSILYVMHMSISHIYIYCIHTNRHMKSRAFTSILEAPF